mmetsp:Transcript_14230/g.39211  ORF Transcript_14230/g.39211 Transcript_14230/m.39211 type:complete len:220 (-) Transcript_14230:103-762(-)
MVSVSFSCGPCAQSSATSQPRISRAFASMDCTSGRSCTPLSILTYCEPWPGNMRAAGDDLVVNAKAREESPGGPGEGSPLFFPGVGVPTAAGPAGNAGGPGEDSPLLFPGAGVPTTARPAGNAKVSCFRSANTNMCKTGSGPSAYIIAGACGIWSVSSRTAPLGLSLKRSLEPYKIFPSRSRRFFSSATVTSESSLSILSGMGVCSLSSFSRLPVDTIE